MPLSHYHLPGEEGDVLEVVTPIKAPRLRMVAMSEKDAEILENLGVGLCRLGAIEAGNVCTGLAVAWKLGPEA